VEDVGTYRAQYAGEVEYVDAEIGRLLAALGERGPDTVVVFVADHGESIGENDFWFTHGRYLSEALVRVPLILRAPGLTPGVRDDVAGLLDLAPTLLALLGVGADALPGRDLLAVGAELASSEVLLANHHRPMERVGLVADGYKYVRERQGARIDESVIRLGGDDAHLEPAPERIPAMRARLRTLRSELLTTPERRQPLSEDDEAALRALGYAE
jgi:arylsulfatase A-like enzyme